MLITDTQLFDTISPLWMALHERGLIDIDDVPGLYEGVLARRRLVLGHTRDDLAFVQDVVDGYRRLAAAMKPPARE